MCLDTNFRLKLNFKSRFCVMPSKLLLTETNSSTVFELFSRFCQPYVDCSSKVWKCQFIHYSAFELPPALFLIGFGKLSIIHKVTDWRRQSTMERQTKKKQKERQKAKYKDFLLEKGLILIYFCVLMRQKILNNGQNFMIKNWEIK